ncbi:MAG: S9 family peptidase [Sphingomonas sp.]|nr:S9 family peptidase [Sphingomonas sp.]
MLGWTLFSATSAAAQADPANLSAAFGAREYVEQISLSPDGNKVAFISPTAGRGEALLVADLVAGGTPKMILRSTNDPERLNDCHWATDTRLICSIYMNVETDTGRASYSRIVAINADGGGLKMLSERTSSRALGVAQNGGTLLDWGSGNGSALITRFAVPESSMGTHLSSSAEGLGVDLVNTSTLARRQVEQPGLTAVDYVSDGQGTVRIMATRSRNDAGYDRSRISYSYRMAGSRQWKPLTTVIDQGDGLVGFVPYAVDPDLNVVYGLESKSGRQALYSLSLDGNLTRKLVFDRPDVDVDDLIRIGRRNRVVGVSYITDRRETVFFDPDLQALRAALPKALPGKLISFIDSSADEKRLLLFAGSDTDPGTYYVFDRGKRSLEEVIPSRPDLAKTALAAVRPITYRAADGTDIPAYLTLPVGSTGKNLPAIVMPHGGPGARDEWGFDWLSQFFAARGYAVIQPNFRGSTGYGDSWYQKNGFQSWRTSIGDVDDAGRWLVKTGIADPGKLAIVGWSYGGYAALQGSVLDPALFKAVVGIAPVTDLETLRNESANFTNFPQVDAFIGHGPWVVEGSPARAAARIKAPVLLFHGDRDLNVGVGESRMMVSRLRAAGGTAELVEFKGLDHQLDDNQIRTQMLTRIDTFLRGSMGMRQ